MNPTGYDRRLDWPDCGNARDLGGLRTTDGGQIRRAALIRSDDLSRLTASGVAAVRAYGVTAIIDLRGSTEAGQAPGPFAGDPIYRHAPLVDEQAERHRDLVEEATLLATYRGSVERNAGHIVAGLTALATAPAGAVVVHCQAGKDRTGMHVALALRVAGARLDEIAADYALTGTYLRERFDAELATEPDDATRQVLRQQQESRPQTILGMLEYLETTYGSVAGYLHRKGLTAPHLAALRTRLRMP